MKVFNFSFIILFLFAVNAYSQQFNSIVSVEQINSIEVKKVDIPRDTATKVKVTKDTVYSSNFLPEREPLLLSALPLTSIILRSGFGYRIHPILGNIKFHNGVDLSARKAEIYSVLHGTVIASSYDNSIGNYIVINHGLYETIYGHLSVRFVKAGDLVKAGTIIGISGRTGRVTGEHLHFIVKYKGQSINPLPFLKEILSVNRKDELTKFLTQTTEYVN
ncbi:M23 family metallopeptidase (plasmid) [Mucilaginibacter robiniae]|uniref:M23 family metallopeptidase n=1 Tax=Mucilaginibacter robiniae TaxID=2728022 RepID=A0A7L5EDM0_9SPHI|nr:M23 family metallopeptidase [Mucilaginibacter robiniae]QJD98546.1 M23 family metallopeptidase [Mucilaginibacter robiniae]